MKSSPCKYCQIRNLGCHGRCKSYLKYRKYKDSLINGRENEWDYIEYVSAAVNRMSGRKTYER